MNPLLKKIPPPARKKLAAIGRQATFPLARATSPLRLMPNYVIAGAQRAGTTSLYRYLVQHPDVGAVRLGKGVHYFDTNATASMGWYRAHFPLDPDRIPLWDGPRNVGEGSPYYMFHPAVPARIKAAIPGIKVIVILRDPVERAHSQWVHETARSYETLDFAEALRAEDGRLVGEEARLLSDPAATSFSHQHHSYAARGQYAPQMQRLWDTFGPENVLAISAQSMFSDAHGAYTRTLDFLGLRKHTAVYEVHNARSYPPIDSDAAKFLGERLGDSNERLVEMLGADFDFRRHD
jgi:hypothetical protein